MPSDKDYLLVLLGMALYVILMHQISFLRTLGNKSMRLEDIKGIDIQTLKMLRERGML